MIEFIPPYVKACVSALLVTVVVVVADVAEGVVFSIEKRVQVWKYQPNLSQTNNTCGKLYD